MDFGGSQEELELKIKEMEEELKKVKSKEEEFRRLKDQEQKLLVVLGKGEKVDHMLVTKDQVSLGSKESDMDQYLDQDERRLIKTRWRTQSSKERKCWSKERLESMPGLGIGFYLVTVLLYQCMNIITKKMTVHPFVILFFRDCLLTPQASDVKLTSFNK